MYCAPCRCRFEFSTKYRSNSELYSIYVDDLAIFARLAFPIGRASDRLFRNAIDLATVVDLASDDFVCRRALWRHIGTAERVDACRRIADAAIGGAIGRRRFAAGVATIEYIAHANRRRIDDGERLGVDLRWRTQAHDIRLCLAVVATLRRTRCRARTAAIGIIAIDATRRHAARIRAAVFRHDDVVFVEAIRQRITVAFALTRQAVARLAFLSGYANVVVGHALIIALTMRIIRCAIGVDVIVAVRLFGGVDAVCRRALNERIAQAVALARRCIAIYRAHRLADR